MYVTYKLLYYVIFEKASHADTFMIFMFNKLMGVLCEMKLV